MQFKLGMDSTFDFIIGSAGNNNVLGTWLKQFAINYQARVNSLYVNSSGNIGIGITTINATVDISGSTAFDGLTSLRLCNNASQYGRIQLLLIGRF